MKVFALQFLNKMELTDLAPLKCNTSLQDHLRFISTREHLLDNHQRWNSPKFKLVIFYLRLRFLRFKKERTSPTTRQKKNSIEPKLNEWHTFDVL